MDDIKDRLKDCSEKALESYEAQTGRRPQRGGRKTLTKKPSKFYIYALMVKSCLLNHDIF